MAVVEMAANPFGAHQVSRHMAVREGVHLVKKRQPDIPWRDVANSGNIYRREYHCINDKMIWKTVTDQLPSLKRVIQKELNSI